MFGAAKMVAAAIVRGVNVDHRRLSLRERLLPPPPPATAVFEEAAEGSPTSVKPEMPPSPALLDGAAVVPMVGAATAVAAELRLFR